MFLNPSIVRAPRVRYPIPPPSPALEDFKDEPVPEEPDHEWEEVDDEEFEDEFDDFDDEDDDDWEDREEELTADRGLGVLQAQRYMT